MVFSQHLLYKNNYSTYCIELWRLTYLYCILSYNGTQVFTSTLMQPSCISEIASYFKILIYNNPLILAHMLRNMSAFERQWSETKKFVIHAPKKKKSHKHVLYILKRNFKYMYKYVQNPPLDFTGSIFSKYYPKSPATNSSWQINTCKPLIFLSWKGTKVSLTF